MYVDYNIHRYIGGQVHEQEETEGNKQRSKQGRKEVAKDQILRLFCHKHNYRK